MQLKEDNEFAYENLCAKYLLKPGDLTEEAYRRQYFNYYQARVETLCERIHEQAKKQIDESIELRHLVGIKPMEKVFVVGTIFKHMKMRPSVLKELAKDDDEQEVALPDPLMADRLVGEEDFLELEDEKQLVKLAGAIDYNEYITGCVIGVYGYACDKSDTFHVDKVITPALYPQDPLPEFSEDRWIAFLSGIQITSKIEYDSDLTKALGAVQHFLTNEFGSLDEDGNLYKFERLIIAGESIAITEEGQQYSAAARYLTRKEESPNTRAMLMLDQFIQTITGSIPVDLMPGPSDPAPHMYPQQPIHKAVFPLSSHHGKMINLCTNPYFFRIGKMLFLGTSGQNVTDYMRLSNINANIDAHEHFLRWQHIAPSVPDTIDGFPLERDPLTIDDTPHVLFCGSQYRTETKKVDLDGEAQVRVLHIPRFSETRTMVLYNLRTHAVREISFATKSFTPLSALR
ncbi:hypothetical protein QR680_014848 [Steinernema hermaphroditum]|uniref:DNA polymerase delta small subunit n=1 Tax=Steinernema hermaphroditum TaxID=289476 RepID=A0AA39IAA7_9BILA|nr:hypothetical protein QR680_014848 [Steinernema hermaphroditum]